MVALIQNRLSVHYACIVIESHIYTAETNIFLSDLTCCQITLIVGWITGYLEVHAVFILHKYAESLCIIIGLETAKRVNIILYILIQQIQTKIFNITGHIARSDNVLPWYTHTPYMYSENGIHS